MINVQTATTAELVAFYNAHANKPVNKFADRKTAERRVNELMAGIKFSKPSAKKAAALSSTKVTPVAHTGSDACPRCGATADITCGEVKELHGKQHLVNEHIAFCHTCGHSWDVNTGRKVSDKAPKKDHGPRGEKIAASWQDKRVAAARATRHAVRVTDPRGGQGSYRSVREAFMVLALPLGQHIKFRGALKASGKAEIQGHVFKLA